MTFADIFDGDSVFLDANTLVYHFSAHPQFGPPCTDLIKRIEIKQIYGFVSTHVVSDVAHRLMTLEAMMLNGWPAAGIAQRLRTHRAAIAGLNIFRQAIDEIPRLGILVLSSNWQLISTAAKNSQQHALLSGDSLIVAMMQDHGLQKLASQDSDFDQVPGLTRYAAI